MQLSSPNPTKMQPLGELLDAMRPADVQETIRTSLEFAKRATQAVGVAFIDSQREELLLDGPPEVSRSTQSGVLEIVRRHLSIELPGRGEPDAGSTVQELFEDYLVSILPLHTGSPQRAVIAFVHPNAVEMPVKSLLVEVARICNLLIIRSSEHAELHRLSQSRKVQVDFLKQILSIGRADYERTFEDILSACDLLIRSRHSVMWLVNQSYGTLTLRAQRGAADSLLRPMLNIHQSLTGRAILANDIVFYPSIWAAECKDVFQSWDKASALDLRSMVIIPIRKDKDRRPEDIVAILSIFPAESDFDFSKEELEIVSTEIGAALRIARDYERDVMLDGLIKGAHQSKDLNSYLHRVAAFISKAIGVEGVSIFVWDEMTQRLQLRGTTGIDTQERKSQIYYLRGEGLTGKVFAEGRPVNGIGIDPSEAEFIFDYGYREDRGACVRQSETSLAGVINGD